MVDITDKGLRIKLEREVDESYYIDIGSDLFPRIAQDIKENKEERRIAILTDDNLVRVGHVSALQNELSKQGLSSSVFSAKAGEEYKTIGVCEQIADQLSEASYGRDTLILALGGGVVGDRSGFIAASFNRGVPYYQIPTTTISIADSSVGGKTGVDTNHGKNLFGAFKQPDKVYIDVKTLRTLPREEYISGLVETIKHGIIQDKSFFEFLENHVDELLRLDLEVLEHIANENCRIKGTVVEQDPHEKGVRRILNYGHTMGHAIERAMNYKMRHGDCVAIGKGPAGYIANKGYGFPSVDLERQEQLLIKIGLPTRIPSGITDDELLKITTIDKKAKGGSARYCLPKKIGEMHEFSGAYATYVDESLIREALKQYR